MNDKLTTTPFIGVVKIGSKEIPCAVLYPDTANPIRVFIQREVVGLLTGNKKGGLQRYLDAQNLKPYLPEKFKDGIGGSVIKFKMDGNIAHGFIGSDLIDFCKMYYDARKHDDLLLSQTHLADIAEIIIFAFAKTGIDSVIDEATGYQDVRVKDAIEKILNRYLLDEAKTYMVTYPLELYKQWFKLNGWTWRPENAQKRPGIIGKWTNEYIYSRLAPGLLKELQVKNPKNEKGYREHKHFQFLTDEVGEPRLREFFGGLIALARATNKWRTYVSMVNKAYPKYGDTIQLNLDFDDVDED